MRQAVKKRLGPFKAVGALFHSPSAKHVIASTCKGGCGAKYPRLDGLFNNIINQVPIRNA